MTPRVSYSQAEYDSDKYREGNRLAEASARNAAARDAQGIEQSDAIQLRRFGEIDRANRDKALALSNFDTAATRVWAAQDVQAKADANAALIGQNARAEAYSRELARARQAALEEQHRTQQQAYWDSLQTGAWRGRTGEGSPIWHVGNRASAAASSLDNRASLIAAAALGGEFSLIAQDLPPEIASGNAGPAGVVAAPIAKTMIDYKLGPRSQGLALTVVGAYGVAGSVATGMWPMTALTLDQMAAAARMAITGEAQSTFLNQEMRSFGLTGKQAAAAELGIDILTMAPSAIRLNAALNAESKAQAAAFATYPSRSALSDEMLAEAAFTNRTSGTVEWRPSVGDAHATSGFNQSVVDEIVANKIKMAKALAAGEYGSAYGHFVENETVENMGPQAVQKMGEIVKYTTPKGHVRTDIDIETVDEVIQVKSGAGLMSPTQEEATLLHAESVGKTPVLIYNANVISPTSAKLLQHAQKGFKLVPRQDWTSDPQEFFQSMGF